MGVGSEVCGAIALGRRGIGCELKPSYYRQAVKNAAEVLTEGGDDDQPMLFGPDDETRKHCEYGGLAVPEAKVV